jgi:hypothetical protein
MLGLRLFEFGFARGGVMLAGLDTGLDRVVSEHVFIGLSAGNQRQRSRTKESEF